jgi:hypothetical protein
MLFVALDEEWKIGASSITVLHLLLRQKNDKFSALNILHLYPDEELCQMQLKMSSLFGK